MRITNNMVSNSYLKNLNMNLTSVDKYQNQLSTGKRLTRLSDDPVGILSSMQIRVRLGRLEQYQKNVDTAGDWLKQTESSLKELNSILQTAYERSIQASTDPLEESDKQAIAEELKQLRDQVLAVGNTKVTNKYIFGGYNTSTTPFSLGPTGNILYNGLDVSVDTPQLQAEAEQNISFEIGYDMNMEVFTNGLQLLGSGDSNIYNLINGMCEALESGNTQDISAYIPKLQAAQEDVLAYTAEIGARSNRLELIENRYAEDKLNFTEIKSKVEDVDEAEAIMQYKMAEATYLYALQIGSNIIQPTLVEYLN